MRKSIFFTFALATVVAFAVFYGCKIEPPTRVEVGNDWPRIYLVNVPPDTSHLPHAPIVYWYGSDRDGYIIAYQWAFDDTADWNTLDVDSFLGTLDTIAFPAPLPDTEFTHVFYVRAVDNEGAVTIADSIGRRVFHVSNIPPVNTTIEEGPDDSATAFVRLDTIATWHGVHFEWSTEDSDRVFPPKFSWKWDNGSWSEWDEATEKDFTGDDDPALLVAGWHTLHLRAMDDAMAIDSSCAPRTIEVYFPSLSKLLLVMDLTRNGGGVVPGDPSDAQVDSFYELVLNKAGFGGFDTVDNSSELGKVPHKTIGEYRMVLLHTDDAQSPNLNEASTLREYLDIGGRLFIGGFQAVDKMRQLGASIRDYFGIDSFSVNDDMDFIGAIPVDSTNSNYSYLKVDTLKVLSAWNGAIKSVGIYYPRNVFNGLYAYDSKSDSVDFQDKAAVIFRYDYDEDDTMTMKVGAATFPLYSLEVDADGQPLARAMGEILTFLNTD